MIALHNRRAPDVSRLERDRDRAERLRDAALVAELTRLIGNADYTLPVPRAPDCMGGTP